MLTLRWQKRELNARLNDRRSFFHTTAGVSFRWRVTLPGESRAGRSRGHGRLNGNDGRRVTDGAVCHEASALPIRVDRHV